MSLVPCAGFVGIDPAREPAPDETTVLKFRHWLEAHNLGERLQENGIKVGTGPIVDATIIQAPSSTKNRELGATPRGTPRRKAISGTSE